MVANALLPTIMSIHRKYFVPCRSKVQQKQKRKAKFFTDGMGKKEIDMWIHVHLYSGAVLNLLQGKGKRILQYGE